MTPWQRTFALLIIAYPLFLYFFYTLQIGNIDSDIFYTAVDLWKDGKNPYDLNLMLNKIQELGMPRATSSWHCYLHFPQALTLFAPFCLFGFNFFVSIIGTLNLAGIVLSILAGCHLAINKKGILNLSNYALLILASIPLFPTFSLIMYGQATGAMILFISIFVLLKNSPKPNNSFFCGLLISLLIVKPQIFIIIILYSIFTAINSKDFRLIIGFIFGSALLALVPWLIQPEIYKWYLYSEKPLVWFTPCLPAWLYYINQRYVLLFFLPLIIAIASCVITWIKNKSIFNLEYLLSVLLPLNLICAPYTWEYDFVILILPLAWNFCRLIDALHKYGKRLSVVLLIAFTIASNLLMHTTSGHVEYIAWYPMLVMLILLYSNRLLAKLEFNYRC